jgi:hypothetical protein
VSGKERLRNYLSLLAMTPAERWIVLCVVLAFVTGLGVKTCRQQTPPPPPAGQAETQR